MCILLTLPDSQKFLLNRFEISKIFTPLKNRQLLVPEMCKYFLIWGTLRAMLHSSNNGSEMLYLTDLRLVNAKFWVSGRDFCKIWGAPRTKTSKYPFIWKSFRVSQKKTSFWSFLDQIPHFFSGSNKSAGQKKPLPFVSQCFFLSRCNPRLSYRIFRTMGSVTRLRMSCRGKGPSAWHLKNIFRKSSTLVISPRFPRIWK